MTGSPVRFEVGGDNGSVKRARLLAGTAAAGLLAGVGVSIVAFYVARYGPSGNTPGGGSWSFRGNGALAAYTLIPGLLAGGWTALVMRCREANLPAWLGFGALATLVGWLLALLDAALLPLFGTRADQALGGILLLALGVWPFAAPAIALLLPAPARLAGQAGMFFPAAAVWVGAVLVGLVGGGLVVPAGS